MNDDITKALNLAYKAHEGQKDKAGKDYILHPIAVALLVETAAEKVVGLLHDVVEDTPITIEDLRAQGFSEEIVQAVKAITRGLTESRMSYLKRVKENPIARAVKIADLKHNSDLSRIANPTEADYKRTQEYLREIEFLKS